MAKILISIIIPVYNVSNYIERCILSIINQTNNDFECIIVDDASQDDSIEKCKQIIDSYSGPVLFTILRHERNRGLSAARNTGIIAAKGKYVWFVDSDDWVDNNSLKSINDQLNGCDILFFNQYYESTDTEDEVKIRTNDTGTGKTLCKNDVMVATQLYVYRREFLLQNDLTFAVGLLHEDNLFTPVALYTATIVKAFNLPVYHKYSNPKSITHTTNPKRCYDLMNVALKLDQFAKVKVDVSDLWEWGHFISDTINEALALSMKCDSNVRNDLDTFISSNRHLVDYLCHSPKIPTMIMGLLTQKLHIPLVPLYQFLSLFRYRLFGK